MALRQDHPDKKDVVWGGMSLQGAACAQQGWPVPQYGLHPALLGAPDAHPCLQVQTTTMCISVSLSGTVVLGCLFTPKLHIILFQPQKNVASHRVGTARFSVAAASSSQSHGEHTGAGEGLGDSTPLLVGDVCISWRKVGCEGGQSRKRGGMEDAVSPVALLCPVPMSHLPAARGVLLLGGLSLLGGDRATLHPNIGDSAAPRCPSLPKALCFSYKEYDHPGHLGGHGHPQHPPPQLRGHHCHGMLGGAAARPQTSPNCCLPVQAQPRHTCPRCAMAVRWWIPRHHPCEGRGPGCGAATQHPHCFPRESSTCSMAH